MYIGGCECSWPKALKRSDTIDTYVRGVDYRRVLRPVNTDRDFAGRRAQLLVQSTVSPYPHILLRYLHLQKARVCNYLYYNYIAELAGF